MALLSIYMRAITDIACQCLPAHQRIVVACASGSFFDICDLIVMSRGFECSSIGPIVPDERIAASWHRHPGGLSQYPKEAIYSRTCEAKLPGRSSSTL